MKKAVRIACIFFVSMCSVPGFISCGNKEVAPAMPTDLNVSETTATSAILTWEGVATTYEINVGTVTKTVDAKTFTAIMLTADTEYTWKVRAVNGNLTSNWTEGKPFKTGEETLSINLESIAFAENEEGEKDAKLVTVTTSATSWEAATTANWLTLSKDGSILIVAADVNMGDRQRDAVITITAGRAVPVVLPVSQSVTPAVSYYTSAGMYYGDNYGMGTANFVFMGGNSFLGFVIEGFATLPESFDTFKLDEGRYTLAEIDPNTGKEEGKARTFLSGKAKLSPIGSDVHDYSDTENPKLILVTEGTFDVKMSGNEYTIITDFTGIDNAKTPNKIENIRLKFTGTITWVNYAQQ